MQEERRIGRRVYETMCQVLMYDKDNNQVELEVLLLGNINDLERATSKVARQLGTSRVMVKSMETTSHYYSMLMSEFIKHADCVTD